MAWGEDSERTMPATPQRRAAARRQGQVRKSGELSAALTLVGIALLLGWLGPGLVMACGEWLWHSFAKEPAIRADEVTVAEITDTSLLILVAGLLAGLWVLAIAVHWLQIGSLWAPAAIQPRGERLSPQLALQQMLSGTACVRGVMWLLRLLAACGLVVWMLSSEAEMLASLPAHSPAQVAVELGTFTLSFTLRLGGVLLVLAGIDYAWQWWHHEQELKLTAEEWRSEQREAGQMKPTPRPRNRPALHRTPVAPADSPREAHRI